jgi:hypothetical protein
MSNRAKLAQVEAAQHIKIKNLQDTGELSPDIKPVHLLSHSTEDGHVEVGGIDRQLIALVRDVSNYGDLLAHLSKMKEQFYPETSLTIAAQRWNLQMTESRQQWIIEIRRHFYEEYDSSKEDDDPQKVR